MILSPLNFYYRNRCIFSSKIHKILNSEVYAMKLRILIIVFLISTFALTEIPKALFLSDTYKQGVYNISESKEFLANAKLAGSPPATFIIIDLYGNEKFFKRFDDHNEVINLGYIEMEILS
jgi:hypothetical protein